MSGPKVVDVHAVRVIQERLQMISNAMTDTDDATARSLAVLDQSIGKLDYAHSLKSDFQQAALKSKRKRSGATPNQKSWNNCAAMA